MLRGRVWVKSYFVGKTFLSKSSMQNANCDAKSSLRFWWPSRSSGCCSRYLRYHRNLRGLEAPDTLRVGRRKPDRIAIRISQVPWKPLSSIGQLANYVEAICTTDCTGLHRISPLQNPDARLRSCKERSDKLLVCVERVIPNDLWSYG